MRFIGLHEAVINHGREDPLLRITATVQPGSVGRSWILVALRATVHAELSKARTRNAGTSVKAG